MNKKFSAAIAILVAFCLLFSLSVCALAGDNTPLLDTSSVADGATDVAVDLAQIDLVFTNNVVNIAVKDNNLKCFSLKSADGKAVTIEVLMGDDQVDPNAKRNISIAIKDTLAPATAYTLTISSDLSAKNGNLLGNDINIGFTTAGEVAEKASAEQTSAPVTDNEQAQPTDADNEQAQTTTTDDEQTQAPDTADTATSGVNLTWVIIIAAVIILLVVMIYARKKTK